MKENTRIASSRSVRFVGCTVYGRPEPAFSELMQKGCQVVLGEFERSQSNLGSKLGRIDFAALQKWTNCFRVGREAYPIPGSARRNCLPARLGPRIGEPVRQKVASLEAWRFTEPLNGAGV
ncbi:MAG: hypothetical protein AAFY29_00100 [Pseudomonadota bacterium]